MSQKIYDAEVVENKTVGQYLGKFPNHIDGEIVDGEDVTRFAIGLPNGVRAAWIHGNDKPKQSHTEISEMPINDNHKPDLLTLAFLCVGSMIFVIVISLFFAPK